MKRSAKRKGNCICRGWVTGGLHINVVKDEEDDSVILDVTAPSGFPHRTAVSRFFVPGLNEQVAWMASDGPDGSVIIRTTDPPAEHRYSMKGFCIPCRLKLMQYDGAG